MISNTACSREFVWSDICCGTSGRYEDEFIYTLRAPALEVLQRSSAWADDNRNFASSHKLILCSKIAMKRLSAALSPLLLWTLWSQTVSSCY